ncbi:MAG: hypothetical protein KDA44_14200 [Planctomycetales bacterium]|nr:hypothetical protein [Planctomycetales bacterium]
MRSASTRTRIRWSVLAACLGAIGSLAGGLTSVARADDASDGATATAEAPSDSTVDADAAAEHFDYPLALEGPDPAPITPPTRAEIDDALLRGLAFLIDTQNPDGSWGSARKTKALNIYAPVPGSHHAFRMGVTSLAIVGICETLANLGDDELPAEQRQAAETAVDRAQDWLLKNASHLRRAETDALYNVWGHSYSLHAACRLYARAAGNEELQKQLVEMAKAQAEKLQRYEFLNGGWSYYDFDGRTQRPSSSPFSFTTATVLVALKDVQQLGVDFPQELIDKATASLLRQRYPDFSFAYGEYLRMMPRYDINRPAGSLGRSQACNLALRLWGDEHETDAVLKNWLDRLYARNGWLSIGRKYPVPHESHFGVAGYFYYYGHFYAAMCIDQLPAAERPHFQQHLAHILLPLQEKDGSWWDYPLYNYHQTWGTAMAMSSLVRCLPAKTADASDGAGL